MLRARLALILVAAVALPLGAQSPSRGLRDQQIADEIRQRLAKSAIGKENFKVSVREGVAYWEGATTVPQRKGAATRMAKAAGARAVVNNIVVRPPPAKPAPAKLKAAPAAPKPGQKAAPAEPASPSEPPPAGEPRRVQVQWGPRP